MDDILDCLDALKELPSKELRQCLETLIKIYRNIISNPETLKFRVLHISNSRFFDEVWTHERARRILLLSGWQVEGDTVQLPVGVDLTGALKILVDNRNVRPCESEWVTETKIVGPSVARLREEELRKKALAEKEKDLAEVLKDKAERKAIAERILAEHRNDMLKRRVQVPVCAEPRRKAEHGHMSQYTAKRG